MIVKAIKYMSRSKHTWTDDENETTLFKKYLQKISAATS